MRASTIRGRWPTTPGQRRHRWRTVARCQPRACVSSAVTRSSNGSLSMSSELDQLRAWVTARAHHLPAAGLSDDLPLLANRHLTSLHLAELILFLERLRKAPIDVEVLQAG